MSTENMRKLMQLTEGLDDNRNDDYCPTCHGWGEILPPDVEQDMDNIIPCPDCGPGTEYEPRLKTKDIKDLAFSMDESEDDGWEVEDFPISEGPSRKDFRMVADLIAKIEDPELRQSSAEDHAKMFALQNPRFNKELFMKACNVSDQEAPELFPGTKDALGKLSIREDELDESESGQEDFFDPDMCGSCKGTGASQEPGYPCDECGGYGRIGVDDGPESSGWMAKLRDKLANMEKPNYSWSKNIDEGPGDDAEWDAHWAREDGDDERADDLEADAEWARMDDELDDVDEGKWDYPDEMKGKEKPYADNYTPSGAKNRKKRKEFRKAEKAKKHAARMRGELDEEFPAQGSEQECAWWAGCTNDATTTEPHPILGDVPICDRCVAKIRKIEGLDEANFYDIMKTNRSEDDDDYYIPRDRHAEHPHTPGYDKLGSGAKAAADSRAKAFMFDEDDGDVPSRRVEDHEMTHALLTKVDSALNELATGMEEERNTGNFDQKQRAIQLRRELKDIKAYLESGEKLVSLFGKVKLANETANELADLSYYFDNVQMDIHDAENLLYLHLNKRPVAIDEEGPGDEVCDDCHQWRDQCKCDEYEGTEDWDECPHCHELTCTDDTCGLSEDLDPDGMGYYEVHIRQGVGTDDFYDDEVSGPVPYPEAKKVALSHVKRISSECDLGAKVKKNHLKAQEGWSIKFNSHTLGEPSGAFVYIIPAEDADVEAWYGESVSLGSIVESILGEAQPKDYEMSNDELASEIEDETSEFERDSIDPEIEDEELGLRFD